MPIFIKRFLEANKPPIDSKGSGNTVQSPSDVATSTTEPKQQTVDTYNMGFDLEDFQKKLSQATESVKGQFKDKILNQILNKKIQFRASKGYGQPEKDFIVNVDDVNIDFYYENYVVVIKGREPNKQKESEYFIKYPYVIKKLGSASVSTKKKDVTIPSIPVPTATQNVATMGI